MGVSPKLFWRFLFLTFAVILFSFHQVMAVATVDWEVQTTGAYLYDSTSTQLTNDGIAIQLVVDVNNDTDYASMMSFSKMGVGGETNFGGAHPTASDDIVIETNNWTWVGPDHYLLTANSTVSPNFSKNFYFRWFNATSQVSATEAGIIYNSSAGWLTPPDDVSPASSAQLDYGTTNVAGSTGGGPIGYQTIPFPPPTNAPAITISEYNETSDTLRLVFDRNLDDGLFDMWASIDLSVDNGTTNFFALSTPLTEISGVTNDNEIVLQISAGDAATIEGWPDLLSNLEIQIPTNLVASLGSNIGNDIIMYTDNMLVSYLTGGGQPKWFNIKAMTHPAFIGAPVSFTIEAWNNGSIWSNYNGTVTFFSPHAGTIPLDYAFTNSDNGVHTFTNELFFNTSGHCQLDISDTVDPGMTGQRHDIAVFDGTSTAPINQLLISDLTDPVMTGEVASITVSAVDMNFRLVTNYIGTINFASSDGAASLPEAGSGSYSFSLGDNGTKTFNNDITFNTIGEQSITVTDAGDTNIFDFWWDVTVQGSGTSTNISHFVISGIPPFAQPGDWYDIGIEARDINENIIPSFAGTLDLTCTDGSATFPPSMTITPTNNGMVWMPNAVQFNSSGFFDIEARLQSNTNILGALYNIQVFPNMTGGDEFEIIMPHAALAGTPQTVAIRATDSYGFVDTNYNGTVIITSSDPGATITPSNFTFTAGVDNGEVIFTNLVTFSQGGFHDIRIEEQGNPMRENEEMIKIFAGGATNTTHFEIKVSPRPLLNGQWHDLFLVAMDDSGLVNTSHTNEVTFMSSDGSATFGVPTSSAFASGILELPNQVMMGTPGQHTVGAAQVSDTNIFGNVDEDVLGSGNFYYVDGLTGSDGNTGLSAGQAWETLTNAAANMASGDIILVAAGMYNESVVLDSLIGGWGGFVADYRGRHFGRAGIASINTSLEPGFAYKNQMNMAICGFEIMGDTVNTGILIESSSYILLSGIEIEDSGRGIVLDNSSDVTIRESDIHLASNAGIQMQGSNSNITIESSFIENCSPGIEIQMATNVTVQNCSIVSNIAGGIVLFGSQATINQNEIQGNTGSGIRIVSIGSVGKIFHNVLIGNTPDAIQLTSAEQGTEIINNTMINNDNGVRISATDGTKIWNNISAFSPGFGFSVDASSTNLWTNSYNCSFNNATNWAGFLPGPGSLTANPNIANNSPGMEDVHLLSQAGRWTGGGFIMDGAHSPCIDAGHPGEPFSQENEPNGGRINIGAFGDTPEASLSLLPMHSLLVSSLYGTPTPPLGTNMIPDGSNITAMVAAIIPDGANTQRVCKGWAGTGSVPTLGSSNSVSFVVTNSSTLSWNWTTEYFLNVSSNINGSVDVPNGWYESGSNITITATASNGYSFAGWTGSISSPSNPHSFTMDQSHMFMPTYTQNTNSLMVSSLYGAPVPGIGTAWYNEGQLINASVTSSVPGGVGTQFISTGWAGTGSAPTLGSSNSVSFNLTNNTTLSWNWIEQYFLTLNAGANGSITGTGGWYNNGVTGVIVQAAASNGFSFTGWTGDIVSTNVTLDLTMGQKYTLNASFAAITHTIAASTGPNGSITPTGSVVVNDGNNQAFTITPNVNYHLTNLLINAASVTLSSGHTFTNVTNSQTIHAEFGIDQGNVTVVTGPPAANSSGAMWQLTSGPDTSWHVSGDTAINIPESGSPYTIAFNNLPQWTKPTDLSVNVVDATTTATNATYISGNMVHIPGATFQMGIYNGAGGHAVTLSEYYIDRYAVSVGEFQQFCNHTGSSMPPAPDWGWANTNLPMVNVKWNEASAYAAWIGKSLPSEAQFEYAMRGGLSDSYYPMGNTISTNDAHYMSAASSPAVVSSYPSNGYGLYNMAGNVWEWCYDWYETPLFGPVTDPLGPTAGEYKIKRGGSWKNFSTTLKCALRYNDRPRTRYKDVGFRCVIPTGSGRAPDGDTNDNNVPDWWESWYFGLSEGGAGGNFDAFADSDGDGSLNWEEYGAGTDPTTNSSVLKMYPLQMISIPAEGFVISWPAVDSKSYRIDHSTNLPVWNVVTTGILAVPAPNIYQPGVNVYTDFTATVGMNYYRVTVE